MKLPLMWACIVFFDENVLLQDLHFNANPITNYVLLYIPKMTGQVLKLGRG